MTWAGPIGGEPRPGCSRCTELERQVADLERELARLRGGPVGKHAPVAHELFAYWKDKTGHPRAKPKGRIEKVIARLRDSYTPDQIRQAIDYVAARPFVVDGRRSATGRVSERFDDLELICRNNVKLDRFAALGADLAASAADGGIERKLVGD